MGGGEFCPYHADKQRPVAKMYGRSMAHRYKGSTTRGRNFFCIFSSFMNVYMAANHLKTTSRTRSI